MLRAPAYPLITVDPYFSVWSMSDTLNKSTIKHWTGKRNTIIGTADIDGKKFVFMGRSEGEKMTQTRVKMSALSTVYSFEGSGVCINVRFLTPLLLDNLKLLSRPVSYIEVTSSSTDGKKHDVVIKIKVSEEICLNEKGQYPVITNEINNTAYSSVSIGSEKQNILNRSGDDLRIDWGYFYLSVRNGKVSVEKDEMTYATAESNVKDVEPALFALAYDDIYSIEYFGNKLKSLWNNDGTTIQQAIADAFSEYEDIKHRCDEFDSQLRSDAEMAGGEEYADLLDLVYRQSIAAHKLVVDESGELLWISKECYSNGCAATVDVTYPSLPLFLLYNTELAKGMLRPIFKLAGSSLWKFPFAPHDAGQYPLVNGQAYGDNMESQMPVEECGNMLLAVSAITEADKNADFAKQNMVMLEQWLKYLMEKGMDPDNQLCTDDFSGHLAHNCNLSLKAICAIAAFSIIYRKTGEDKKADECIRHAKKMADEWLEKAQNQDGSFRLAFDRPGTFSMKYNMVWDKLMNLGLFPAYAVRSELSSYAGKINAYGLPLDNRASYTKSDWTVWIATLAPTEKMFREIIHPLWLEYNLSPSRVPATDWYDTITSIQTGFQNRTVQGGLFIKLLDFKGL